MSKYELTCEYCGHIWKIDYIPTEYTWCEKCKDHHIKVKDLSKHQIDYYQGSPAFEEKTKEIILEEKLEDDGKKDWFFHNGGFTTVGAIEKLYQGLSNFSITYDPFRNNYTVCWFKGY